MGVDESSQIVGEIRGYNDEELRKISSASSKRSEDALLEKKPSILGEQTNHVESVSKELFDDQKIDLRTEVSDEEIKNLARLRFMSTHFKCSTMDVVIDSFLSLRVSKERKSRGEFIQALQTERRNNEEGQTAKVFQKLFGSREG